MLKHSCISLQRKGLLTTTNRINISCQSKHHQYHYQRIFFRNSVLLPSLFQQKSYRYHYSDNKDSRYLSTEKKEESHSQIWQVPIGEQIDKKKRTLYEFSNHTQTWLKIPHPHHDDNNNNITGQSKNDNKPNIKLFNDTINDTIYNYIIKHFLPNNYPNSVEKGYTKFISYCFLANTCSSAAMVLSTQTLLLAVGVGSSSASPMAGALNWVMKDGIGQLGGILFASRITSSSSLSSSTSSSSSSSNTTTKSSYSIITIDTDPKRWRMVSALSMDISTFLEILTPYFPGYFLCIASIANVGKNIGFLTASASRASLHQSVSICNNLDDVTAKAGSQSIAASLMGTAMGIGLTPLLGEGGAGGGGDGSSGLIFLPCINIVPTRVYNLFLSKI